MQVSNATLSAMLDNSEAQASTVSEELQEMRLYLEAEGDAESSRFLKVLQARECPLESCDSIHSDMYRAYALHAASVQIAPPFCHAPISHDHEGQQLLHASKVDMRSIACLCRAC
jgi:hypothetical protein